MPNRRECDATVIIGTLVVFILPLTLLIPDFSVWNIVPKIHVTRFHIFSNYLTWTQLNSLIVTLLAVFFCLYLEIRKRKLDDMVENVLTVSQATDNTMGEERDRQAAAVKVCVELLDASADHYENLVLLRDELRKRENMKKQHAPIIELSSSEMQ